MTRRRTTRCPRPCYPEKNACSTARTSRFGRERRTAARPPEAVPPFCAVPCHPRHPLRSASAVPLSLARPSSAADCILCKFMERSPACSYGRGASCENREHLAAESCGRTKRCRPNKEGKVGAPGHHMGTKVAKKGGKRKRGYGRGARILLILLWCARQESNLRPTA